jgi:hypothetical protein
MPDFATSSRHWMVCSAAHGGTRSFWSSPKKILEHLTHLAFDRRTGILAPRTCFVSVIQNEKRPCASIHHPRLTDIQYILTHGRTCSVSCAKVNRSGCCLLEQCHSHLQLPGRRVAGLICHAHIPHDSPPPRQSSSWRHLPIALAWRRKVVEMSNARLPRSHFATNVYEMATARR